MRCPYCGHMEDKVVDSRVIRQGEAIRRRRECEKCGERFTSFEIIEPKELSVVKKDGRYEKFDREKIVLGMMKSCEKRGIPVSEIDAVAKNIEKNAGDSPKRHVTSVWIGAQVMKALKNLDPVAYVRFASVYREFKDVSEFVDAVLDVHDGSSGKKK